MTDQKLNELALNAWKDAMGDASTAVKLLRDRTDLGLREALTYIQKTAHQVGGRCNLRIMTKAELPPELAEALAPESRETLKWSPRLSEHRARRGVKKVRGAK
jgi:hypothetical protein